MNIILALGIPSMLLTWFLTWVFKKNYKFKKIIDEFKLKLPRTGNQASKISNEQIDNDPILKNMPSAKNITCLNLSTQITSITNNDFDIFYNNINNFDYKFVLFKKEYKQIVESLNRFSLYNSYNIAFIQRFLSDKINDRIDPLKILMNKIKHLFVY